MRLQRAFGAVAGALARPSRLAHPRREGMSEEGCACPRSNDYDCWRTRYDKLTDDLDDMMSADAVKDDGGPCQCVCHDAELVDGWPLGDCEEDF
jgi:hypothetical protein